MLTPSTLSYSSRVSFMVARDAISGGGAKARCSSGGGACSGVADDVRLARPRRITGTAAVHVLRKGSSPRRSTKGRSSSRRVVHARRRRRRQVPRRRRLVHRVLVRGTAVAGGRGRGETRQGQRRPRLGRRTTGGKAINPLSSKARCRARCGWAWGCARRRSTTKACPRPTCRPRIPTIVESPPIEVTLVKPRSAPPRRQGEGERGRAAGFPPALAKRGVTRPASARTLPITPDRLLEASSRRGARASACAPCGQRARWKQEA